MGKLTSSPYLKQCGQNCARSTSSGGKEKLTDAHGRVAKAWNVPFVKSMVPLERPGLVGVVQVSLAVVRDRFTITIHDQSRVVVLGAGGPVVGRIDLLRIADSNVAVVFQSSRASPESRDPRSGGLKKGGDLLE